MKKLSKEFEKLFGKEKLSQTIALCGHHSKESGSQALEQHKLFDKKNNPDERLAFALLEMLDYECYNFNGKCNLEITEKQIKDFLLSNKTEVNNMKIPPPSYMGAIVGVFNFLIDKSIKGNEMMEVKNES